MRARLMIPLLVLAGCGGGSQPDPSVPDAAALEAGAEPREAGAIPEAASACPPGLRECAGSCVDNATSLQHCGQCGHSCAATEFCEQGSCHALPAGCPPGGCPFGTYCDLNQDRCVPGCLDDKGCSKGHACNGSHACVSCAFDDDKDGHYALGSCLSPADDCDDHDPDRYPGKPELCDGKDNNCNGKVDEGATTTFHQDLDGDGFGSGVTKQACSQPAGHVKQGGDCDDSDGQVAPGKPEGCDGKDNDCNGKVDDGITAPACAKTLGVCVGATRKCGGTAGWLDCAAADYGPLYQPTEASCDGKDNDCDGVVDGFGRSCSVAHKGACAIGNETCSAGSWTGCPPPASESCDGVDNDCDGSVDEGLTPPLCPLSLGVCAGKHLNRICLGQSGWAACTATTYGYSYEASETKCDALDNDCDGVVDGLARSCAQARKGICATGNETCAAGVWAGCPQPKAEVCGNALDDDCDGTVDEPGALSGPGSVLGSGSLPRLRATTAGFLAAYLDATGTIVVQPLDASGAPQGAPFKQAPVARPVKLLDLVVWSGGVGLGWVEDRPAVCCGPTKSYVLGLSAALVPAGAPQVLPTSGSTWDKSEEIRLGTRSGGAGFVVAERIFTNSPGYGTRFRFGLFPAVSPSSTEFYFQSHGSQSQGANAAISIAELPSGFAIAFVAESATDRARIAAFWDSGAKRWGPLTTYQYPIGRAQSVTYDGSKLMSLHHWGSWRNRTFEVANGAASPVVQSAAFLDWPVASDAAYLGPLHLQLLESGGNLQVALFDATGALHGEPAQVVTRSSGACSGQCARLAVRPSSIGLLHADGGTVSFQPLCR